MHIIFLHGDEPFSQYPNHYVVTSRLENVILTI